MRVAMYVTIPSSVLGVFLSVLLHILSTGESVCKPRFQVMFKQYVEIEDTKSKMQDLSTGVPQGSILGQLLYFIYVNDFALSSEKFKFVIYADDTTVTSKLETFSTNELNGITASSINIELNKISEWLKLNRLTLNVQKTKYMLFKTSKKKPNTVTTNG